MSTSVIRVDTLCIIDSNLEGPIVLLEDNGTFHARAIFYTKAFQFNDSDILVFDNGERKITVNPGNKRFQTATIINSENYSQMRLNDQWYLLNVTPPWKQIPDLVANSSSWWNVSYNGDFIGQVRTNYSFDLCGTYEAKEYVEKDGNTWLYLVASFLALFLILFVGLVFFRRKYSLPK